MAPLARDERTDTSGQSDREPRRRDTHRALRSFTRKRHRPDQLLPGLQRGMHQPGFTHLVLSGEERRVINMHRNLERYLDLPESERISGGDISST